MEAVVDPFQEGQAVWSDEKPRRFQVQHLSSCVALVSSDPNKEDDMSRETDIVSSRTLPHICPTPCIDCARTRVGGVGVVFLSRLHQHHSKQCVTDCNAFDVIC